METSPDILLISMILLGAWWIRC